MPGSGFIPAVEAAAMCGVSRQAIVQRVADGTIRSEKEDDRLFVHQGDALAYRAEVDARADRAIRRAKAAGKVPPKWALARKAKAALDNVRRSR